MTQFALTELVNSPMADVTSAALGASSGAKFVQADIGKPVKLGTADSNYVVCSAGDEIEGFVSSVEIGTVNDGFSFGGVVKNKRKLCKVDAAQSSTIGLGSYVVAGASAALGTADAYPKVKSGVATNMSGTPPVLGTPVRHLWRVVRIVSGTGVAGDLVLIERV